MTLVRDFNYPLFYERGLEAIGKTRAQMSRDRFWKSPPRMGSDNTWEVLQVNFRKPVSVAQISFEVTEVPHEYELWYYNRRGARVAVLDRSRRWFKGTVGDGQPDRWTKIERQVYPLVATRVELRLRRTPQSSFEQPRRYSLCVRNFICKRNVLNRTDAEMPFEVDVDPLGNVVTRTVKDWDAQKAADSNAYTFWKSEPQPSPEAVVSMYLDVRDKDGNAQRVDRLWLDPVYSGQSMNIYYSDDDTVGTRRLSPSKLAPMAQVDANWTSDGLRLDQSDSVYQFRGSDVGFDKYDGSWWWAFTWVPDFQYQSPGFANNLILFNTGSISVQYNYSTKKIGVYYQGVAVQADITFESGQQVRIALSVDGGRARVIASNGDQTVSSPYLAVGKLVKNTLEVRNVEGVIEDLMLKLSPMSNEDFGMWSQSPEVYLSPDPVLEDEHGRLPSVTTDNVVIGANYLFSELPSGGMDSSFFESKMWDPVWRDYTVSRGFYHLPLPIYAKYLKLEFTDLTEEPYPVWEAGIDVKYKAFPVSVTETAKRLDTLNTKVVKTSASSKTVTNGKVTGASRTSSTSVSSYGTSAANYDIQISLGTGMLTDDIPHLYDKPVTTDWKREVATREVYSRSSTSSSSATSIKRQAEAAYYTVVSGDWLIKIGKRYKVPWEVIYEANKKMIDSDPRVRRLPKRSKGWWIFPGQKLKIPAAVMKQITSTTTKTTTTNTTVTERKTTTTSRRRFQTTSVHRYEVQTAKRDSAIAYFAGLREVQVFLLNYMADEDTPVYNYPRYDSTFGRSNVYLGKDGTVTAAVPGGRLTSPVLRSMGTFKRIEIDTFDRGLVRGGGDASTLAAVGLNTLAPTATWDDSNATWDDLDATWGAGRPFVTVGVDNTYFFAGQPAAKVTRVAGVGAAGITTQPFRAGSQVSNGGRMRLKVQMFRPEFTDNVYTLNVVNGSAGDAVLYQEPVNPQVGQWETHVTRFFKFDGDYSQLKVQLIVDGEHAETVYVGTLSAEFTSTIYEVSNDGGVNWYEATEVVNRDDGYFVFPTADNRLMFRAQLNSKNDYIFGVRITPLYLT